MTKIYFETAGCSANFADSEQMAGLLKQAKFEIVNNLEDAYVVVFNTCTVKGPSETGFFKRLQEVEEQDPNKLIVIAGCIAQTAAKKLQKYPLVGTNQIHKVVEVVEEALNDNVVQMLVRGEQPPLNLPRVRKNPIVSIIPISRGCLSACTYCMTKNARGNLVSYPIADIVKEAQLALKEDIKEIWITSQDNGCYGFDLNTNLAQLLKELVKLPGDFKIRLGMMSPQHLIKYLDQFLEIFAHEKIFKFIHLPVQSGSNIVLKNIKREYTVEEFMEITQKIKERFPQVTLATDIIAGFPGETEEQHWETLNLLTKVSPDVVNLSRFWPRPNTRAASMKALPGEIVKNRSSSLTSIFENISKLQNEKWLGWEGSIIIDEKGKEEQQWIGRNPSYKQVLVSGNFKLGDIVKVKINKHSTFDLRGEVVY